MFNKYLITKNEDYEDELYLFVDNSFEFSKEFGNKRKHEKNRNLISNIVKFLNDRKIKFNGSKVFLVSSGIVIGAIYLSQTTPIGAKVYIEPKIEYAVSLEEFNNINIPKKIENTEYNKSEINKSTTPPSTSTSKGSTNKNTSQNNTNSYSSTSSNSNTTKETENKIEKEVVMYKSPINVYRKNGSIETMELEDFLVGVVSAEMPAEFNIEALKAQSVASRTYYLKAISKNKKIYEISDGQQIYKDINTLKTYWGSSFNKYYSKIKSAVSSTEGKYITYNGSYIEAVYSSTNNGKTESSQDVWGNYYPYLISVDSSWDISAPSYYKTVDKDLVLLGTLLGMDLTSDSNIEVLSKTDGDSIGKIKINDTTFSGVYLRNLLGLRSTDFDIVISGNIATIKTRGYGHGVGMSQYGANGMAKAGYNYAQILQHYYPGTQIK